MILELDVYTAIALIMGGIIVAFIGKKLLRIAVGIIGGGALALLTNKLALMLGATGVSVYVVAALAFIIGFFIAWFVIKLALALVTGISLGLVLATVLGFMGNLPLLILSVLISIGIMYLLADKILGLVITILGTILIYLGLSFFIQGIPAIIVAVVFFIVIAYFKLRK